MVVRQGYEDLSDADVARLGAQKSAAVKLEQSE